MTAYLVCHPDFYYVYMCVYICECVYVYMVENMYMKYVCLNICVWMPLETVTAVVIACARNPNLLPEGNFLGANKPELGRR